jgi:hypothetical protein
MYTFSSQDTKSAHSVVQTKQVSRSGPSTPAVMGKALFRPVLKRSFLLLAEIAEKKTTLNLDSDDIRSEFHRIEIEAERLHTEIQETTLSYLDGKMGLSTATVFQRILFTQLSVLYSDIEDISDDLIPVIVEPQLPIAIKTPTELITQTLTDAVSEAIESISDIADSLTTENRALPSNNVTEAQISVYNTNNEALVRIGYIDEALAYVEDVLSDLIPRAIANTWTLTYFNRAVAEIDKEIAFITVAFKGLHENLSRKEDPFLSKILSGLAALDLGELSDMPTDLKKLFIDSKGQHATITYAPDLTLYDPIAST